MLMLARSQPWLLRSAQTGCEELLWSCALLLLSTLLALVLLAQMRARKESAAAAAAAAAAVFVVGGVGLSVKGACGTLVA